MKNSIDTKIINYFESLPADYWTFRGVNVHRYTHALHTYPAIMVSPISKEIISLMQSVGKVQALFDPFMGSGTVAVEGMLAGVPHIAGNDLNPLGIFLTKVKTTPLQTCHMQEGLKKIKECWSAFCEKNFFFLEDIENYLTHSLCLDFFNKGEWSSNAYIILNDILKDNGIKINIPKLTNLGYWFKPRVIIELCFLRDAIYSIEDRNIRDFFLVAFSEVIRLASNRRSGEFKMYRMPIEKLYLFSPDIWSLFYKISLNSIKNMGEFSKKIESSPSLIINYGNACHLDKFKDYFYDLIITSPPYGDSRTTVAYGQFSRLSLGWLSLANEEEIISLDKKLLGGVSKKTKIYQKTASVILNHCLDKIAIVDEKRCQDVVAFYYELDIAIRQIAKKTSIGGYHFWVVGDRTVKNIQLPTANIIIELAAQYDLKYITAANRGIPNKVMPSFNSPSNIKGEKVSTMLGETILVFRKY